MIDDNEIIEDTEVSEIELENIEEETTIITTTVETTTTTTTTTILFDKKINDIQSESEFFGVLAFMLFVIFICTVFFNKGR